MTCAREAQPAVKIEERTPGKRRTINTDKCLHTMKFVSFITLTSITREVQSTYIGGESWLVVGGCIKGVLAVECAAVVVSKRMWALYTGWPWCI
jgi:hypothetical protein